MAASASGASPPPLAIGIDIGGTWIRLRARARGLPAARAAGRLTRVGDPERFLEQVWHQHRWGRADIAALVVCAPGIWTAGECARRARQFSRFACHVRALPDAQAAALGALDGRAGVLVLSGTGAITVGHDGRARWERAGGFGALLGDEGSGFWLGREWLRATTGPGDFEAVRRLAHASKPVAAIAALAPMVIARARAGDPRARRIVATGQAHLAACARHVARQLDLRPPVAMSWAGGVLADPWFRAGVARAVGRGGLQARWSSPAVGPVVAAVRLAEALARAPAPRQRPRASATR
jgi:N-acetylglucosamine kinase-like BadF-type ATPase